MALVCLLTLFAVDPPDAGASGPMLTTNQVLYLIAAILVPALGGMLFCLRMFHHRCKDAIEHLEKAHRGQVAGLDAHLKLLTGERDQLKGERDQLRPDHA